MPVSAGSLLMEIIGELAAEVETVFNLSVALAADQSGQSPLAGIFGKKIFRLPNGKVNIGLASEIAGKGE